MPARERIHNPLRAGGATRPDNGASGPHGQKAARTPTASLPPTERLPLRELTGWEEEYLERHQHEANTARVCNEVLARCCVPPGQEPADSVRDRVRSLLIAERDRELVRLRLMSLGPEVEGQVACPECATVNQISFSLTAIDLDVEVPAREHRVTVVGRGTVELVLPCAGDQEDLLDAGVDEPAQLRSWLLGRCVRDENGAPLGVEAARALPMASRMRLEKAIEELAPSLELQMAMTCVGCRAAFTAPFDVTSFFFRIDRAVWSAHGPRSPARRELSLVRGGHLVAAAAPPGRLPAAAGGRRGRRPDGLGARRRRSERRLTARVRLRGS